MRAAFLNNDMDRKVYVTHPVNLPKGMRQSDLYMIRKALYGLHQSPVLWYRDFFHALHDMGFEKLHMESTAFNKRDDRLGMDIVL